MRCLGTEYRFAVSSSRQLDNNVLVVQSSTVNKHGIQAEARACQVSRPKNVGHSCVARALFYDMLVPAVWPQEL